MSLSAVKTGLVGCLDYVGQLKGANNTFKLLYFSLQTIKLLGVHRANALACEIRLPEVTMCVNGISFLHGTCQVVRKALQPPEIKQQLPPVQKDTLELVGGLVVKVFCRFHNLFLMTKKYVPYPYHNFISDVVLGLPYIVQGYRNWNGKSFSEKKIEKLQTLKSKIEELNQNIQKSQELQKIQQDLEDEKKVEQYLEELEELKQLLSAPEELSKKIRELKEFYTMVDESPIKSNHRKNKLENDLAKATQKNDKEQCEKIGRILEEIYFVTNREELQKIINVSQERIDSLEERISSEKKDKKYVDKECENDIAKLNEEKLRIKRLKYINNKSSLKNEIEYLKVFKKSQINRETKIKVVDDILNFVRKNIIKQDFNDQIRILKKAHQNNIEKFLKIWILKRDKNYVEVKVKKEIAGKICHLILMRFFENLNEGLIQCNTLAFHLSRSFQKNVDLNKTIRTSIDVEIEYVKKMIQKIDQKSEQVNLGHSFAILNKELNEYFTSLRNIKPKDDEKGSGLNLKARFWYVQTPEGRKRFECKTEFDEQFDKVMNELQNLRQIITSQENELLKLLTDQIVEFPNRKNLRDWRYRIKQWEKFDPKLKVAYGVVLIATGALKELRVMKNTHLIHLFEIILSVYQVVLLSIKIFAKPALKANYESYINANYESIYIKDFSVQPQPVPA